MIIFKNSIEDARLHTARTISFDGITLYMSTNSEKHTPDTTLVCVDKSGTVKVWGSRATLGEKRREQAFNIEKFLESLRTFDFDNGAELPLIASRIPGQHGRKWSESRNMDFVTDQLHKSYETKAAFETIMSVLNPEVVKAIGSMKHSSPAVSAYNIMIENPDFSRSVIDIYNRHPWLSFHVDERMLYIGLNSSNHRWEYVFNRHPDDAVRYIIENDLTTIDPESTAFERGGERFTAGVRAMVHVPSLSFSSPEIAGNYIRFMSSIPISWAKDWCKLENLKTAIDVMHVVTRLTVSNSPDSVTRLLAGSRGDINHVAGLLGKYSEIKDAAIDLRDCVSSFKTDVINPLLRSAFEGSRLHLNVQKKIGDALTRRMLGFEGLGRLVEISEKWHRMEEDIRLRKDADIASASWPPIAENYKASNGLMIIPLSTAKQLSDEGSRQLDDNGMPGLNHCVGSYDAHCKTGHSHIISVRRRSGRQWERVSTVEYALNVAKEVTLTERQHRAYGNSRPPADAMLAVSEWLKLVRDKKISLNIDEVVRNMNENTTRNPTDPMKKLERGLLAWHPLLKREYRDMTAEDLVMHAFEFDERARANNGNNIKFG